MNNKYTTFVNSFNSKIKQNEAIESITTYSNTISEKFFTDMKIYNETTYPSVKLSTTVKLPLNSTLDGNSEPVGSKTLTHERLDPLYEKMVSVISVEEMEYAMNVYQGENVTSFLADKMKAPVQSFNRYVNNANIRTLKTGIYTTQYRVDEGQIKDETVYDFSSDIGSVSVGNFYDVSDANATRMGLWAACEAQRKAYNISSGGLFLRPTDIVFVCHPTIFAMIAGLFDVDGALNRVSLNEQSELNLYGYTFIYDGMDYYVYGQATTGSAYTEISTSGLTNKQMLMIDKNSGIKGRYLKVSTTNGSANGSMYYMEAVEKADRTGWDLWFRAKYLPIVNGKGIVLLAADA